jgi:hypothetical protein
MPNNEAETPPSRSFWTAESFRWVIVTLLIPFTGFVWNEVQEREVDRQKDLERVRADEQARIANARGESDIVIKLMPSLASKDDTSAEQGIALAILLNLASREALSPELASAISVAVVTAQQRVQNGKASEAERAALTNIAAATDVESTDPASTGTTRGGSTATAAQEFVVAVPRVYIHIFGQTHQGAAEELQKWIAYEKNWLAPGVENVAAAADRRGGRAPDAPAAVEVRFFNDEDAERAREVASWLSGRGAPDARSKKVNLKAPAGQLEVWFPA